MNFKGTAFFIDTRHLRFELDLTGVIEEALTDGVCAAYTAIVVVCESVFGTGHV